MDPALIGLIGASIGATGAVGGQVVAQILTARRERTKAKADQREQRRTRFIDIKRAAFVEYLRSAEKHSRLVRDRLTDATREGDENGLAEEEAYNRLKDLGIELNLIAPEVYHVVDDINRLHLDLVFLHATPPDEGMDFQLIGRYSELIHDLRDEMRASLGIDVEHRDTALPTGHSVHLDMDKFVAMEYVQNSLDGLPRKPRLVNRPKNNHRQPDKTRERGKT